jgi:hypothetical protein
VGARGKWLTSTVKMFHNQITKVTQVPIMNKMLEYIHRMRSKMGARVRHILALASCKKTSLIAHTIHTRCFARGVCTDRHAHHIQFFPSRAWVGREAHSERMVFGLVGTPPARWIFQFSYSRAEAVEKKIRNAYEKSLRTWSGALFVWPSLAFPKARAKNLRFTSSFKRQEI